jgi:hypothetical protein
VIENKKNTQKIENTTYNAHLKSSTMTKKLQHHQGKKVREEKTFGITRFLAMTTKNTLSKQGSKES